VRWYALTCSSVARTTASSSLSKPAPTSPYPSASASAAAAGGKRADSAPVRGWRAQSASIDSARVRTTAAAHVTRRASHAKQSVRASVRSAVQAHTNDVKVTAPSYAMSRMHRVTCDVWQVVRAGSSHCIMITPRQSSQAQASRHATPAVGRPQATPLHITGAGCCMLQLHGTLQPRHTQHVTYHTSHVTANLTSPAAAASPSTVQRFHSLPQRFLYSSEFKFAPIACHCCHHRHHQRHRRRSPALMQSIVSLAKKLSHSSGTLLFPPLLHLLCVLVRAFPS
jgi:hypothetical protein